jgi:hypothetical protein
VCRFFFIAESPLQGFHLNGFSHKQWHNFREEGHAVVYPAESIQKMKTDNTLSFTVQDPEGIVSDGFQVKFAFRNSYHQRVFVKRAAQMFGLTPPPKPPPKKSSPTPKQPVAAPNKAGAFAIIFILMFIFLLVWVGSHKPSTGSASPSETQAAAVAAIKKLGGTVTFDRKNPGKPRAVFLRWHQSDRELYLEDTYVTYAGVKDLQSALPKCRIVK